MSCLNKLNEKCDGCKHKGIYMCTGVSKCKDNDKYEKRKK